MPTNNDYIGVLHRIKVKLYTSHLPTIEGAYTARTDSDACLTIEQVCAAAKNRGGVTGSYDDLVKHVRQFFDEAAYQLCDGFAVNTGYFSIHPNIAGTFDSIHEPYNAKKHPIVFRFRTRPALRRLAKFIEVEIMGPADTNGSIDEFIDIETGAMNETVTSGGIFSISGRKVKIAGDVDKRV